MHLIFVPALPWGNIPVLDVDGKRIAQSSAICRFLANRFKLAGADEFEKAKCDEIVDSMRDFAQGIYVNTVNFDWTLSYSLTQLFRMERHHDGNG